MINAFSTIVADPYRHYEAFKHQVGELIAKGRIPRPVVDVFEKHAKSDPKEDPFIFVRNMPIDVDVPRFDNDRPVYSKYELKKTFIAEASLSLIGHLLRQTPIGYLNVNGGDVFQDIYPAKPLKDTQSQKAIGPIYFHKDLANHYVRPDYVNMISMRASAKNDIYTTFVKNVDVISALTPSEIEEFRKVQFYTPFDDLTVKSGRYEVGDANRHPIISGDNDIRFFENRTVGTDERSSALVTKLIAVLHQVKKRVQMCPGDFIGVANNHSVHGKEIGHLEVPEEAWGRWSLKTVNVGSTEPHRKHLVSGSNYLIAG
ncbi:hypothetical protein WMF37_22430 [Sorangium sp. So ce291]|uniref:hypothetical protein n=1 Tax=Sorangium sp. So ce291 TaxID=3133294 RepID=UPI003F61AC8C